MQRTLAPVAFILVIVVSGCVSAPIQGDLQDAEDDESIASVVITNNLSTQTNVSVFVITGEYDGKYPPLSVETKNGSTVEIENRTQLPPIPGPIRTQAKSVEPALEKSAYMEDSAILDSGDSKTFTFPNVQENSTVLAIIYRSADHSVPIRNIGISKPACLQPEAFTVTIDGPHSGGRSCERINESR